MSDPKLPSELLQAVETELQSVPRPLLAAAAKEISAKYRNQEEHKPAPLLTTKAHHLAYLAVRLPATFAAVMAVLEATVKQMPDFAPNSLADLGAGPGTAAFACLETFPTLKRVSLYESDPQWIAIGKALFKKISPAWSQADISKPFALPPHDLTLLSYSLGELTEQAAETLVSSVWKATEQLLILIEPGTPRGFSYIRRAREHLLAEGAFLVAPCPHLFPCPMQKPDWCHFATRLPRSEMHLLIKEVERGFEDEKFSYIVASKTQVSLPYARVLRHPEHHGGHTRLVLCTPEGIKQETFSRKHKTCFKEIKKTKWGADLVVQPSKQS